LWHVPTTRGQDLPLWGHYQSHRLRPGTGVQEQVHKDTRLPAARVQAAVLRRLPYLHRSVWQQAQLRALLVRRPLP